jgi:hypothetical protein
MPPLSFRPEPFGAALGLCCSICQPDSMLFKQLFPPPRGISIFTFRACFIPPQSTALHTQHTHRLRLPRAAANTTHHAFSITVPMPRCNGNSIKMVPPPFYSHASRFSIFIEQPEPLMMLIYYISPLDARPLSDFITLLTRARVTATGRAMPLRRR